MPREAKTLVEIAESRKEFVTAEDGFVYYWPSADNSGCYSSHHLRMLADELDRRNKQWLEALTLVPPLANEESDDWPLV